jgi:hypothetical protein
MMSVELDLEFVTSFMARFETAALTGIHDEVGAVGSSSKDFGIIRMCH